MFRLADSQYPRVVLYVMCMWMKRKSGLNHIYGSISNIFTLPSLADLKVWSHEVSQKTYLLLIFVVVHKHIPIFTRACTSYWCIFRQRNTYLFQDTREKKKQVLLYWWVSVLRSYLCPSSCNGKRLLKNVSDKAIYICLIILKFKLFV